MSVELYFLRSSEAKIVADMLKFAHEDNEVNKKTYTEFYGLKVTDLGLHALDTGVVAGAIWSRKLTPEEAPRLSVAVLPKIKRTGVGIFMMEQFLQEAGALYEEICIDISHKPKAMKFYNKYGFTDKGNYLLIKKLEKKEVIRPTDGYDPTRWID